MVLLPTVHRGLAFEQKCLNILQDNLSMNLRRVGGKSDGGIDLMGWWWLPSLLPAKYEMKHKRIRILAQCKAEKKKIGPNYIRELEGVLHRLSHNPHAKVQEPIVALFLSQSAFTKGTILRAMSSPLPFFLLHIPPASQDSISVNVEDEEPSSAIGSVMWNPALGGSKGLLQGAVDLRWERSSDINMSTGRPGLWSSGGKIKSWVPQGGADWSQDEFLPELKPAEETAQSNAAHAN